MIFALPAGSRYFHRADRTGRQAVPAMQTMFLRNHIGNTLCQDAVLRTDRRTTSAADAGVGNKIPLCSFLCSPKGKGSSFYRLLRQVEPLAATFINLKHRQCLHGFFCRIDFFHIGIQLRLKCNELMQTQGHPESAGSAKITPAYNLSADYVIHTVGPIVQGPLTEEYERLPASCYTSCLNMAAQNGLKSIAFCCISTGVFMFQTGGQQKLRWRQSANVLQRRAVISGIFLMSVRMRI